MINDPTNPDAPPNAGAPGQNQPYGAFSYSPLDYSQFAKNTGYGYNDWLAQMNDAFSMPSRGAGVFMGNTAPRYGQPAPNLTFPTAFQGLLGQSIGQPQGGGGGGMPPPGVGGATPPPGGGMVRGNPAPKIGLLGGPGGGGVTNPLAPPTPQGVMGPNTYGAVNASNPLQAALARSLNPNDSAALLASVGGNQGMANQLNNSYGVGGVNYDPQAIADQTRGVDGGIADLAAPTRAMYEQQGIIKDGKWVKKQYNSGNYIPV